MRLIHSSKIDRLPFLFCPALMIWSAPASAHSMYQSAVLLDFRGDKVDAELQLPADRLSISFRQSG
jgi:hypothetical protein